MNYPTFKEWFETTLKDYAKDIANHKADCGFPEISYTSDCVELFDQFGKEIWDMAYEQSSQLGCKNVAEMIANFNRTDLLDNLDGFKVLMVWFAVETLSYEVENDDHE